MIRKIAFLTALVAIPVFAPSTAKAEEYCREYTKTVSINGRAERAYGTACYRPDGSWEIVSLKGTDYARRKVRDIIYDDIEKTASRRDYEGRDRVIVVESYRRPHYYNKYRHRVTHISYGWPFTSYSHYHHKPYYKKHYGHQAKYKKHVKNKSSHHARRYSYESHSKSHKNKH